MATQDSTTHKQCSKKSECLHPEAVGGWLPATSDYFMPHKGKLYSQCHYCRREAKRQSHVRNREHNNKRTRRWYSEHPDYTAERYRINKQDPDFVERNRKRAREWGQSHREQSRKRAFEWYQFDPDRARASRRRSYRKDPTAAKLNARARKIRLRAAEGECTPDDIRLLYKSQRGLCWWCGCELGSAYHIDHRIPLVQGGSNHPDNLVLSCPQCNLSKGGKLPQEWNGRLL